MGRRIRVKVSYTDNAGNFEGPLVSEPTDVIRGPLLVKNTEQALYTNSTTLLDNVLSSYAQGFRVGSGRGYSLESIGIGLGQIDDLSTVGSQLVVQVHKSGPGTSGSIGDFLCTLVNPSSFTANSVNYFSAPATGCILVPNTFHFVSIMRTEIDDDKVSVWRTLSDDEDAGASRRLEHQRSLIRIRSGQ